MTITSSRFIITADGNLISDTDLEEGRAKLRYRRPLYFEDGTDADQINQIFSDERTLGIGASEDLDLSGGIVNAFGVTITFSKIKSLVVYSQPANGGDIQVGGAAANAVSTLFANTSDIAVVKPGGFIAFSAPDINGYGITAGTAGKLKINNVSGAEAIYEIVIYGVM